jgi:hypothetical protein
MTPFNQDAWACRCEWGPAAVVALAPANVTIVIDVFSFTTCVDMAQQLGSTFNVIPAGERWPDGSLRPALLDWLGAGGILRLWLPNIGLEPAAQGRWSAVARRRCVRPSNTIRRPDARLRIAVSNDAEGI